MYINGGSTVAASPPAAGYFTCVAPVGAGQFTIPAYVLLSIPASETGTLTVTNQSNPVVFTAAGIDYGVLNSSVSYSVTLPYR